MKKVLITLELILSAALSIAQVGVGTTTPNSTLDVRGSLSVNYRAFTTSTTAGTDNMLVFTGTSAATLTLPDATTCAGRVYWAKNASSNASVLTIATTSSQTIDGLTTWSLDESNESARVVSNGANWYVASQGTPNNTGSSWNQGGNTLSAIKKLGTISNHDLPFITNNTEKMRLSATGNLGIGTSTFNGTYPEKLVVDAGTTTSVNAIVGKGSINNYLQLNIQNTSSGTSASSDVVATADNGTETTNYVDMGINSSTNTSGVMGVANDAYLYNIGQNFLVGTGSASKALVFMTGGTTQSSNERMRVTGSGDVGIGITSPNYQLHMHKSTAATSNWMQITNNATGTGTYDGFFYGVSAAGQPQIWGEGDLEIITGSGTTNKMAMDLTANGNVGISTSTFNGTYPEKLLVDAGSSGNTNYQNVIVGKGNTNSYAQLNIQNSSSGSGASSDVVATANNGSETANYIDMGINSSGYSATGILGGANNAYLYSTGNDFVIGNSTDNKSLIFYTTASATNTERMRITNAGLIPGQDNAYSSGSATKRWTAVYAANGTIQTSDLRLKKNIRYLPYGIKEVMQLKPVSYNWKENDEGNKIGLIAQEVRKVIPEVVVGDESKENLGMNYAELVPLLINAIKEQEQHLKGLQVQIDLLKKEIELLKSK